ncbi:MAG: bis(5'-nucleosyl)-tetraphosphatase (symmetrical) YqeK [Syntrophomonadaceae bacterium]|nr:bis(5'-nucleosyl)-tetraphosphatase (symmetrical) YqeK [Syntrophomonadaceae bacterium]
MSELTPEAIADILSRRLSAHRWQHSLNVAATARQLALGHGQDPELAERAGLLHDYAKGMPDAELLSIARAQGLLTDPVEEALPDLLHAPVGAHLLATELGVTDARLLSAVRHHTMGSPDMSPLDQIIFLADMIEPGRHYPQQQLLIRAAHENLERAMLAALDSTIEYCLRRGRLLHPRTVHVRNCYLTRLGSGGRE